MPRLQAEQSPSARLFQARHLDYAAARARLLFVWPLHSRRLVQNPLRPLGMENAQWRHSLCGRRDGQCVYFCRPQTRIGLGRINHICILLVHCLQAACMSCGLFTVHESPHKRPVNHTACPTQNRLHLQKPPHQPDTTTIHAHFNIHCH